MDKVMENLAEKQPILVNRDRNILLHDYAHPHTANRAQFKYWNCIWKLSIIFRIHWTFHQLIIIFHEFG